MCARGGAPPATHRAVRPAGFLAFTVTVCASGTSGGRPSSVARPRCSGSCSVVTCANPAAAVVVVGPRGLVRRRLYSAGAIALALTLFGVLGIAPGEVRRRVSPLRIVGATAAASWASLRRWSRAVRARSLFPGVRALPDDSTLREVAARAATTLAACAPGPAGLPLESAAFLGASM
jgi:hypothetical protein